MDYEIRRVFLPHKRKRHRIEIFLAVLRIINEGYERPTHIMYRTNLSWNPLTEVFDILLEQKLITLDKLGSAKFYHITEKGKEVLKYFERVDSLMTGWKKEF